ncbi:MAG: BBP7 family outer membrane beta-barrel protein [Aureliella sp.]
MKKTWLFGIAFALGLSNLPCPTQAQYAPQPTGSDSLAPSGYAIDSGLSQTVAATTAAYGQQPQFIAPPSAPRAYQSSPSEYGPAASYGAAGEYGPASVPAGINISAQRVAYPQEAVPAPAFEAEQVPQQGWVGPRNGQYQAVPPVPQPVPLNAVPSQAYPGNGYAAGSNVDPAYANALAPAAMNPESIGSACSSGACGDSGLVSGGLTSGLWGGRAPAWLSSRAAVPGKAWFVGSSALLFRRVDDRPLALTYDTAMPTDNPLTTRDARQTQLNGFEVFTGRYFNCGRNALMLNYWGLFPGTQTATITNTGGGMYRSRHQFNGIEMPSDTVYNWYDGATSHRVMRSSQYHNVEGNLLGFAVGGAARTWGASDCGCCGSGCAAYTGPCGLTPNVCGGRLNLTWLAGVRWFRFTDKLQYAASENDSTYDGSADDLYYDNNVRNDLVGFQLGGVGSYCLGKRFNLYALSKAGIYNNHSQLYTRIGTNGAMPETATINSGNIYNGQGYLVNASQNNAAFLGEIGTGIGARISKGWSANVGYRVIGVSGVATSVNTVPIEMLHLGNVANYNTTSSLILHGVTIGGMYNF